MVKQSSILIERKIMKNKKAFTLVELMIVIAIIGVLVGMLTPMISGAYKKAIATNSKTFMSNMAAALERYRDDNGDFPKFLTSVDRVNLNDGDNAASLYKMLVGKNPDGSRLSAADRKEFNRRSTTYMDFNMNSIVKKGATWKIVDSFGNPNIYVCVDADFDDHIKKGLPARKDGIEADELKELVPNPSKGLMAKVVMFTLRKDSERSDADYSAENIYTWY